MDVITVNNQIVKIQINNVQGVDDITVYIDGEKIMIEFFTYVYAAFFRTDDIFEFIIRADSVYLAEKFFKYDVYRKSEEKKHFNRLIRSINAIKDGFVEFKRQIEEV